MAGGLEGVPAEYQNVVTFLGLIGAALLVAWRYATGFLKPTTPPPGVQGVGRADTRPSLPAPLSPLGGRGSFFASWLRRGETAGPCAAPNRRSRCSQ